MPAEQVIKPGEDYRLTVTATFADGSTEDVTALCSFDTLDRQVARVSSAGRVEAVGPGDAAVIARYRAEPALALAVVPRPGGGAFPDAAANNFIDKHVLAKLRRLESAAGAARRRRHLSAPRLTRRGRRVANACRDSRFPRRYAKR